MVVMTHGMVVMILGLIVAMAFHSGLAMDGVGTVITILITIVVITVIVLTITTALITITLWHITLIVGVAVAGGITGITRTLEILELQEITIPVPPAQPASTMGVAIQLILIGVR
jgi:hypothetical protein